MQNKDSLGDRQKSYEDAYRHYLPNRCPMIIRLDGKGWHQVTKKCKRPYDENLVNCLNETAIYLCKNIQGTKIAYLQSDEISLLIFNPDFNSQPWFDNNLQKITSVSSALASSYFTSISDRVFGQIIPIQFDARCFIVPPDEVTNAFIWRQQDATRNSVQMLARSLYSHKQCTDKNNSELQEMTFQKGINWNDCPTSQKRGRCILKMTTIKPAFNPKTQQTLMAERHEWVVDNEIPIFSQDRNYIDKHVKINKIAAEQTSQEAVENKSTA